MPSALRQQLRLPFMDMGIDGVFVTAADDPVCYHTKFRYGRPPLTWRELSTFYGLADAGGGRLVFTNCDEAGVAALSSVGPSDLARVVARNRLARRSVSVRLLGPDRAAGRRLLAGSPL